MGKLSQEQVKFWIEEINSCETRQKRELQERNLYPLLIDYYEGLQTVDAKKRACIINEYFPNTNALISELVYQNPEVLAEPTKPEAENNAPIMKSALTYGFKKLDALTENKIALFDMIMAGYCAVEVNHINLQGQDFTTQFAKPMGEAYQGNFFEKTFDKAKELFGVKKSNTSPEDIETNLEKNIPAREEGYATTDETFLKRWCPLDVLLDYRAERIKDLRYIVKRIKMSKAEFNARYPELKDKINATDNMPYAEHKNDLNKKTVTLYEVQIYQGEGKAVNIVISKDYGISEVDYFERPFIHNGFTIKIGVLHEYGKLYPISFGRVNKALQDDINRYVTFMMEVAERNIPKRGYNKNKVKEDGLTALNNSRVNESVPVDGGNENIWEIPATNVSLENKELLQLWQQHKEKTWNISESRLLGRSQSEFATEMQIQEAGFENRQIDLQQGLRKLIVAELDCLKDIIVQFWDDAFFFKITGASTPSWYIPQVDPMSGIVLNPLTDILTADYEIDIDITSALRPNKQQKKKELIEFAQWITSPQTMQFLQMQGKMVDVSVITKVAAEWGWNPETLLIDFQPQVMPGMVPPEGMPQQGVPVA